MLIKDMLQDFNTDNQGEVSQIQFSGCEGYDVYNITAPFEFDGTTMIAGRVEQRESEDSKIVFFEKTTKNRYEKIKKLQTLKLQDPFITKIKKEWIIGGVELIKENDEIVSWRTNFYRMKSLTDFKFIFSGPDGMKDIRLKELSTGKILVLTRPQGEKGGRGKIGATLVDALEEINQEIIDAAPLLKNNFEKEEWGGANEIYELSNGEIAVLGHVANFDGHTNHRNYYAMTFKVDLEAFEMYDEKIIAERSQFVGDDSKRDELYNVVFSGGLEFIDDESVYLYAGVGDVNAQYLKINNPFDTMPRSEEID